jgi:hypothetical protein
MTPRPDLAEELRALPRLSRAELEIFVLRRGRFKSRARYETYRAPSIRVPLRTAA